MISRLLNGIRDRWHPLWRLRQLAAYRWLQQTCDFTVYTSIPDTGIRVAVRCLRDATWIASPASLEPGIRLAFALVLDQLRPAVFWDVGANIGFYSWLVRRHRSVRQVVMFEPDPTNYALLTDTIRRNAIRDCLTMNIALSDTCGETTFLIDRVSGAAGSLEAIAQPDSKFSVQRAYQMTEIATCATSTVDDLIAGGLPVPEFIKIDVEGAEHLVLRGADKCIGTHRPILLVETANTQLIAGLRDMGYRTFRVDAENILFVPPVPGVNWGAFAEAFPVDSRRSR